MNVGRLPAHLGERLTFSRIAAGCLLLASAVLVLAATATAHVSTIGYSRITSDATSVTWTLWLDPYHLNTFLELDGDDDGTVTQAEVDAQRGAIRELAEPGLEAMDANTGEQPAAAVGDIRLIDMAETDLTGDEFTSLGEFPLVEVPVRFEFAELDPAAVQLTYNLFLAAGFGDHNNVAEVDMNGEQHVFTFAPEEPAVLSGDLATGAAGAGGGDGTDLKPFALIGLAALLVVIVVMIQRRASRARGPARRTPSTSPRPLRSSR